MSLDKTKHYVYRVGSDNQYRLFWNGSAWCYELLAGGVIFDNQTFDSEETLSQGIAFHGLQFDQFEVDETKSAETYSKKIHEQSESLKKAGIHPCPKHGLSAKNLDGSCEACSNADYPDDFKGTEG